MGLREQIDTVDDTRKEPVVVPEWGDLTVYIRVMSGDERERLREMFHESNTKEIADQTKMQLAMIASTLCDETGALLYSMDDLGELGKKNSLVLDQLSEASRRINGLGSEDVEEAKKNSSLDRSEDSGSTSPSSSGDPSSGA